jgi:hypothetical protein
MMDLVVNAKPKSISKAICHIRDARGREVSQLDPMRLHLLRRPGTIEADVLEQIVEELEPGAARRHPYLILALAATAVLGAGGAMMPIIIGGPGAWRDLMDDVTNPAIYVPSLFVVLFLPWMFVHARRTRCGRVSAVLIKFRRCPHCGYSLRGLPVDPTDGATVCPECACAWRIDDPAIAARAAAPDPTAAGASAPARWVLLVVVGLTLLAVGGAFMMWFSMT